MCRLIDEDSVIDIVVYECGEWSGLAKEIVKQIKALPSAQLEPLTDTEQRIFLAAMGREKKVCKQVDEESRNCCEYYESLVSVCCKIIRKVKVALWT